MLPTTTVDHSSAAINWYHKSTLVLLAATPVAVGAAADSPYAAVPLDLVILGVLPYHMHVGMNFVITDYGLKFVSSAAAVKSMRYGMIGVTGL